MSMASVVSEDSVSVNATRPREGLSKFIREWQESSTTIGIAVLKKHVIMPDSPNYNRWWSNFILIGAAYSSVFTPIEFGFFRGLPKRLAIFDSLVQLIFLADIVVNFFVAFKDKRTYRMITDHRAIALRYAKTDFFPDLIACLPWDLIYKAAGRNEGIRYLLWIRLYRVRKVERFFQKVEKDSFLHYFVARITKLLVVEFYCTHTAACIFYYLATTVPRSRQHYTWIGSLELGGFSYDDFPAIDLGKRYVTALYWAILTMATVGYGDIHPVNVREMLFVVVFVSFDMILGAYLIGNMTALIVKGSTTEKYRDRMASIAEFSSLHTLPRDLKQQMKSHVRLEFERQLDEGTIMKEFPASIRAKVSQALYRKTVEAVPLFENCSFEFINQIVSRVHREYFLPGEIIMEQGHAADRLFIVDNGLLEEVSILEDGSEEIALLDAHCMFGEIAVLCNIPQPYTVRVRDLSGLLQIDKQAFAGVMQIYAVDSRQVLNNLLKKQSTDFRIKQLAGDIQAQLSNQHAELTSKMNNATYQGDFYFVRSLIREGADPTTPDYAGRTPLHIAASKGYDDIVLLLLREGANINAADSFGSSPLLEAVRSCHDSTARILVERGGRLLLRDQGSMLCNVVISGNLAFLRRLITHGADPNASDYDLRTPLHIAAAEGLHLFVRYLISAGANIRCKDRWGHTPLDEAQRCGSVLVRTALEEAQKNPNPPARASKDNPCSSTTKNMASRYYYGSSGHALHSSSKELARRRQKSPEFATEAERFTPKATASKTCILVPGHPCTPLARDKHGILVSVPSSIEELLELASELFGERFTKLVDERGEHASSLQHVESLDKLYAVVDEDVHPSTDTCTDKL